MTEKPFGIPENTKKSISGTPATETDRYQDSKEVREHLEQCVLDLGVEYREICDKNKTYKENYRIKQFAIWASFISLIAIPGSCFYFLHQIVSRANEPSELTGYGLAAFVVSPITFVGAVLGFMFKGVLSSDNKVDEKNSDVLALLKSVQQIQKS